MTRSGVLIVAALLAVVSQGCASSPGPTPAPAADARPLVAREVRTAAALIRLGEPLPPAVARQSTADTVVAIPAAGIARAQAVRAHLTPTGLVRMLWVDYAQSANYAAMVAEYASTLGRPRREAYRTGERVWWEDGATRFELVRDPERSVSTVFGVLTDLRAAP